MDAAGGGKKTAAEEEDKAENAKAWSWGAGTDGQLATGTLEDQHLPQPLRDFPPSISHIACGGAHAIALTGDGRVLSWGRGTRGQLGHGELGNCLKPKPVKFLASFTISYVSAGWNHSGFVTDSGRLFMCGDGSFGQLGNGDNQSHDSPVEVLFFLPMNVEQIACGMRHSLVLVRESSGNSIYGFGSWRCGQIGSSVSATSRSNNIPKLIDGFQNNDIFHICANGNHSAALSISQLLPSANGQLYTWGRGFSGTEDEYHPRIYPSHLRFSQVALGWNHALTIADDKVYMLGGKHHGLLGGSQHTNMEQLSSLLTAYSISDEAPAAPALGRVPCIEGERIVCISAGAEHSALVTEKGNIMTWGWGEHGQLGLGNTDDQTCPQMVDIRYKGSTDTARFRVYCGSGFTFVLDLSC